MHLCIFSSPLSHCSITHRVLIISSVCSSLLFSFIALQYKAVDGGHEHFQTNRGSGRGHEIRVSVFAPDHHTSSHHSCCSLFSPSFLPSILSFFLISLLFSFFFPYILSYISISLRISHFIDKFLVVCLISNRNHYSFFFFPSSFPA